MATVAPGCDLAVEHAAFEAGRQDVAEHDQRLLVGAVGDGIEAGVGVGDAHVLRLGAVDGVAEDPAAGRAVRVHAARQYSHLPQAVMHEISTWSPALKAVTAAPTAVDDADALVAEDAAGRQVGTSPLRMCRSVPQMVVLVILTMASVAAVISGLGRSSKAFLPGP